MKSLQTTTKESAASAVGRGSRLKTARMMTGLTRKAMNEKYGISVGTLQSWEAAKAGGLTTRGAQRVLPIFYQEGVVCTVQWLLYGIDAPPQMTNTSLLHQLARTTWQPDKAACIQELRYFRQIHPGWADFIVNDDGMAPHYQRDDVVAGRWRTGSDISTVLGSNCIVQTARNEMLLRHVRRGGQPGRYDLICTNLNTTLTAPVLYNQQLLGAAPVVWHRRMGPI